MGRTKEGTAVVVMVSNYCVSIRIQLNCVLKHLKKRKNAVCLKISFWGFFLNKQIVKSAQLLEVERRNTSVQRSSDAAE